MACWGKVVCWITSALLKHMGPLERKTLLGHKVLLRHKILLGHKIPMRQGSCLSLNLSVKTFGLARQVDIDFQTVS